MTSCGAGGDNPGLEYAPNMYHSVAYEPYSQIVDEDAGRWLTSIDYPLHGEYPMVTPNFSIPTSQSESYEHAEPAPEHSKPK